MGETKMSKLLLLSQVGSTFFDLKFSLGKENSSIDRMKIVASGRCNSHTLHHLVRSIIPKITNNM